MKKIDIEDMTLGELVDHCRAANPNEDNAWFHFYRKDDDEEVMIIVGMAAGANYLWEVVDDLSGEGNDDNEDDWIVLGEFYDDE